MSDGQGIAFGTFSSSVGVLCNELLLNNQAVLSLVIVCLSVFPTRATFSPPFPSSLPHPYLPKPTILVVPDATLSRTMRFQAALPSIAKCNAPSYQGLTFGVLNNRTALKVSFGLGLVLFLN
jgi:hypothetical protein